MDTSPLDEIDASVLEAAKQLKVISRYGVRIERVDLESATRLGIIVTNTPGTNSVAVAELADEATFQMGQMALQDCMTVLRGERPGHVVNPIVFDQTGS